MADKTGIQWTDATWNPVRGCSLVSAGCTNCYAMKQAHRFSGTGKAYDGLTRLTNHGPVWTGEVRLVPELLDQPLRWKRPRRIFVNSMSDLFHEKLAFEDILRVFDAMVRAKQHTFQVLTKRPRRAVEFCSHYGIGDHNEWPANIWLGVSVEDQQRADERIPQLLATPALVRFLSCEPLLERVDLATWIGATDHCGSCLAENPPQAEDACPECGERGTIIRTWGDEQAEGWRSGTRYADGGPRPDEDGCQLHWVIVGGESGPRARPFNVGWARSIVEQCADAGVACFVKQLGAGPFEVADPLGARDVPLRDPKGGDWNEWTHDLRVRQFPEVRS